MKNFLRDLRKARGWTQEDFAIALEVSRQTVNALEAGRYDPSLQLLPRHRGRPTSQLWHETLTELESRALDLAILPIGEVPPRFVSHKHFDETFAVTMRKEHPLANKPSLKRYCAMRHLLVSLTGDAHGVVDEALAQQGLSRRVALTVPSFMMALSTLAQTDLIGTLPRQVVAHCAQRFGLETVDLAVLRRRDPVRAIATKAAVMDAGIAWLFALLKEIPWNRDKASGSSQRRDERQ